MTADRWPKSGRPGISMLCTCLLFMNIKSFTAKAGTMVVNNIFLVPLVISIFLFCVSQKLTKTTSKSSKCLTALGSE